MIDIKIMVCCHKEAELPKHEYFFPIQVGKALTETVLPYTPDDTGENISEKNHSYCELTAHYWMWKNKHSDIIGLNHYRRYFDFFRKNASWSPDRSFTSLKHFLDQPYRFDDIDKILKQYDIILPPKRHWPYSLHQQYCIFHIVNDWNILREVIMELSPDYISAFDKFFYHNNALSNYNMFITRWDIFDKYSEWIFKILFEMEKRVKLSGYQDQGRLFGYLTERLINVFCMRHNLRVKYIPVIMPLEDPNAEEANPSLIKHNWRKIKNDFKYKISVL